jgi:hypothetical protein
MNSFQVVAKAYTTIATTPGSDSGSVMRNTDARAAVDYGRFLQFGGYRAEVAGPAPIPEAEALSQRCGRSTGGGFPPCVGALYAFHRRRSKTWGSYPAVHWST